MKRRTRMLLGISVALITAASLHFTVGHRFHHRQWGHYGHSDCGSHSRWGDKDRFEDNASREPTGAESP
ncbi:hypothetical protein LXM26_05510 [Dyadobacter sp. LJ419]|uniref:Uncharacterized protein n=1 Tax=Dyadobacter chenwenxiniae TaxID=2906456 RepID=A0A9X1TDP8_9BACT|nr:hypothetical protein [Dyadobacter chenwenxiniae]MCF0060939.1 hypothetical protein [Dyadobacter chenwenxiniae]